MSIIIHLRSGRYPMRPTPAQTNSPVSELAVSAAPTDLDFLRSLGERVRDWRARRGMTRKILARDSGVSQRYLAQLEAGQGNISILLLRQIASALGIPISELLSERQGDDIELLRIKELLRRMPAQQLPLMRARLTRDLNKSETQRRRRVALIGLRGAGKSTLGARLARGLNVPFVELDREIEREAGTSLNEIFLLYGQAGYRRYERRALETILEQHDRVVIATGGSIVSEPATYDLLLSSCYTVWIKASPEEHMARVLAQGDTRPMSGNKQAMEDLRRILLGRASLYAQADLTVDTTGKAIEATFAELRQAIESQYQMERP